MTGDGAADGETAADADTADKATGGRGDAGEGALDRAGGRIATDGGYSKDYDDDAADAEDVDDAGRGADADAGRDVDADDGDNEKNKTDDDTSDTECPIPPEATTGGTDPDTTRPTAAPDLVAYRHDVHKLRGHTHANAADVVAGVPVNESVPLGADRDAALLSRPHGKPDPQVANHTKPTRLSRISGQSAADTPRVAATTDGAIAPLVTPTDADELHARWLTSSLASAYAESAHYPYTSLQYHTLLTAALLDAYRAGYDFEDLSLVATTTPAADQQSMTADAALAADGVEPHRTVLWTPAMTLHITPMPGDRPAAQLGDAPAQSFADTWSRLPEHPIDVEGVQRWRTLDAHLRRIRSWSTALAFVDDYIAVYGPTATGDM